jgi:predicted Rossmann fold nucleotide-binding protein DprA/Smf involved in DNA uptake
VTATRRYGFSGSRTITDTDQRTIDDVLGSLLPGSEYTTGGCIGVDTIVGRRMWLAHQKATHRVVVPADRSRVSPWWMHRAIREAGPGSGVLVEEMPPNTTYKDRNQRIVDHSNVLVAFPAHSEDDPRSKRSGTWQTIRMARRAGLEVLVTVLGDE